MTHRGVRLQSDCGGRSEAARPAKAGHHICVGAVLMLLLAAPPARAQSRAIGVRAFALAADERFAADTTFKSVVGSATQPLWGGGVDVVVHRRFFVDFTVSRMSKSGQRVFLNNGEVFSLGIPLRMSLTPIELAGGYRLPIGRSPRVIPYGAAGVGLYEYSETSDFASAGDDVRTSHAGFLARAGVEFRVTRWLGVSGDAQYTHVPGIFGRGGVSLDANEHDLGGLAGRLRVLVGR